MAMNENLVIESHLGPGLQHRWESEGSRPKVVRRAEYVLVRGHV